MTTLAVPERPILNLAHLHWDHRVRGLRNMGTWLTAGSREPAMVLAPLNVPLPRCVPCVLPLNRAYLWTEEFGDPLECAFTAVGWAPSLGLSPFIERDVNRILDCVRERLDDLIQMPPAPRLPRQVAGDITIRLGGPDAPVQRKDILDDV